MQLRWLSGEDVARNLTMRDAVDAVGEAYVAAYRRRVEMPVRLRLDMQRFGGTGLFMPSHSSDLTRTALKVVSVYPGNAERGLPTIMGVVALFDGETGQPLALMEGSYLTALRTGAASGASSDALARADARTLALIGAGAQAPYQALAVCAVRPIETIRLYNRTRDKAVRLAERLTAETGAQVQVSATTAEAIAGADVVCTATSASEPVLAEGDLPAGVHVSAVGSFDTGMRELPRGLFRRSGRIFVDQREAALEESGEVVDALDSGTVTEEQLVEVGAVLTGERPGRRDDRDVTVFKSCGLSVQDLFVAARAYASAVDAGAGTLLDL